MKLTDIHSHILPCVDDGAANTDEAIALLEMEVEQGVTDICLTPHLRRRMFEAEDTQVKARYQRLCEVSADRGLPIRLHLSREYFYDDSFRRKIQRRNLIPMGTHNVVLVEFRYSAPFEALDSAADEIKAFGYVPLFAHIERYEAIQKDPECAELLRKKGVLLQVNANAILGLDGWKIKHVCAKLIKTHNVHVIASDTHDPEARAPNMKRCADYLEKKIGWKDTQQLMYSNPLKILSKPEEATADAEHRIKTS